MENTIELVTKFEPYTDEIFTTESKKSLLTNLDFSWSGAHSIKIYKVTTAPMNDYGRSGPAEGNWSRYGVVEGLDATTQELILQKDRSFTFTIDALDEDETGRQLAAASALARQLRQVVIPEVDSYTYAKMCDGAGHKPDAKSFTAENIYPEVLAANEALDASEVPETGRTLILTPSTYTLLKKSRDVVLETDIGNDLRLKGVIGMLDGLSVLKVPANRLPKNFGFMVCHPVATVAPTKLESYNIHTNPPGINGSLVEGRIVYDCFTLDNKRSAIYYQAVAAAAKSQ